MLTTFKTLGKLNKSGSNKYEASIIIPVFNEEVGIARVIEDIKSLNGNFEIIVVNDGSTDKTSDVVRQSGVKFISHTYNKGYGAALKSGIRNASADIVIFMDGDGQHRAADVQLLLSAMENYDMVVGARTQNSHSPFFRKPGKKILSLVANYLSGTKIPDLNSGFRAIKKERVLEFMHILPNGFSLSTTITLALLNAAYNVRYVPITTMRRNSGKSLVCQHKDGLQTMLLIIRIIVLFNPFKVFAPMALFLFFSGFLFSIYGVFRFHRVPGTGIITILSGVIIFFFGIIADQISAMRRDGR